MEDCKTLRYTAYDLSRFDSIEELIVFDQVYSQSINGEWRHSEHSRRRICEKAEIAEITCKVLLRTLLQKGALTKRKKAVYVANLEYVTKQA
jgi:predicted transcriptional regulator